MSAPPSLAHQLIAETAPSRTVRVCDVIVDMLVEARVDVVFGLPGGPISPIHDALLDHPEIRHVTVRHESGALFAACGYARTSGKVGVAVVTSGPGALNAMTGLASAHCDGLPVLLLVGEVPRRLHGKGALQDGSAYGLNIVAMASHISKLAAEVGTPHQAALLLRRALTTIGSGRRGPAVLTIPMDVALAPIAAPRIAAGVTLHHDLETEVVDEIAGLFAVAARPLILAGSGCRQGLAPSHLRAVAERLGCPVVTTPKAKGVFPEDHRLALGVFGLGGHPSARAYVESGVDVLLVLGSSLGDLSTDGFSAALQPSRALIQVDIEARQIGKSYAPTHAVVAPCEDVLAALVRGASQRRMVGAGGVQRHALSASATGTRIAPHAAIAEIQEILPRDTIFTVDSGEHFLFAAHFLEIGEPDAFLVLTGLGSMGQSIGAAIGAQLARPARAVAAICGDGCFAMNAFEVATAVVEKLPICVFVMNDGCLTMVEQGHQTVYGRRPRYSIDGVDICAIAKGLGATVRRAERPGDIRALRELIRGRSGPVVIEVLIDRDAALPKKDRIGAFSDKS